MKTDTRHRQGQEAKHAFFKGVKRTGVVEGNADREQTDGHVHQVRVQRNAVRKVIGPQGINNLVDGGDDGAQKAHEITPLRIASTTGTVCSP